MARIEVKVKFNPLERVEVGDIIIDGNHDISYLVSQVANEQFKLIRLCDGNRQTDDLIVIGQDFDVFVKRYLDAEPYDFRLIKRDKVVITITEVV